MTKDAMSRLLNQAAREIEERYATEQKAAAADLHNAICVVIEEKKPTQANLLFVLEVLRHEALNNMIAKFIETKV